MQRAERIGCGEAFQGGAAETAATPQIMRVGVDRGSTWSATPPTVALRAGYLTAPPGNSGRSYDISPDGRRFLLLKDPSQQTSAPPQIVVVQHFDEELKRLVPTN